MSDRALETKTQAEFVATERIDRAVMSDRVSSQAFSETDPLAAISDFGQDLIEKCAFRASKSWISKVAHNRIRIFAPSFDGAWAPTVTDRSARVRRVIHLAPFGRNVGDNALNMAIETMLAPHCRIERMELVGNPFDQEVFQRMNSADAVIFGGGGVIHSCSGGGSRKNRERTGTMWNMDLEMIAALRCKIVLYSVGFNRFEREPPPLKRMEAFFELLDARQALVSFRNDGSRERFLDYFPQFAGVTVTPDPGLFCRGQAQEVAEPYGLLQIATDRLDFRYPGGIEEFADLVRTMRADFSERLLLIPHTAADAKLYDRIAALANVDEVLPLRLGFDEVGWAMELYRNARFTISTRGHSQICSIGNGTPTFALSTHPKARGFMEAIGQPDSCFDYLEELPDLCRPRFQAFLSRLPELRCEIELRNAEFDTEIADFNQRLIDYFDGAPPPPLLTNPAAIPTLEAADLEADAQAPAAAAPTDMTVAYLPGRTKKAGVGTYPAPAPASPPPRVRRRWATRLFSRKMRTADGARCGAIISCDANYFAGVETCLRAVRRYNPRLPVTFLDAGVTPEQATYARVLFDDYRRLDDLLALDVAIFPSHLSKAALSSLHAGEVGYDKILYLDVDALVLDDLTPLFCALDSETDIVGVRGNLFGRISKGLRHVAGDELAPGGKRHLQAAFPQIDLTAPAINSGCFVVWRETARNWMPMVEVLLPYLRFFRTADQALLNVMSSALDLRVRFADATYNCMGLQVADQVHPAQDVLLSAEMDAGRCTLFLGERPVRVAHFAGRRKPWMDGPANPASRAWDWHSASDAAGRRAVAARHQIDQARTGAELARAGDAPADEEPRERFERALAAASAARLGSRHHAARDLYDLAARMRSESPAAARGQVLTRLRTGRLASAAELLRNGSALKNNRSRADPALMRARVEIEQALSGVEANDPPEADAPPARLVAWARAQARAGKREILCDAPALARLRLSGRPPESAIPYIYSGCDNGCSGAIRLHGRVLADGVLLRRGANTGVRNARRRLDAAGDALRAGSQAQGGAVAQIAAGSGAFVVALAHVLKAPALTLDGAARHRFLGYAARGVEPAALAERLHAEGPLRALIAGHISDRIEGFAQHARGLAATLAPGGLLVLIDAFGPSAQMEVLEGFQALPPVVRPPSVGELEAALAEDGLSLAGAAVETGERILIFIRDGRRLNANDAAPALSQLQTICARLADASCQAEHSASEPRTDAGVTAPDQDVVPMTAPRIAEADETTSASVPHVAYWSSINLGDAVLSEQTAALFESAFPLQPFRRQDVNRAVACAELEKFNRAPFALIGGGGLIHSTARTGAAWQWRIELDMLRKIETPLILFGVGLNEFRGEDFYSSASFRDLVGVLADRSIFLGFREQRSCEIIRRAAPEHADKIVFQPCASLLIADRFPFVNLPRRQRRPHVAFNAAFDRATQRFGGDFDRIAQNFDALVGAFLDWDWDVSVVCHCPEDALVHTLLARREDVGLVDLSKAGSAAATQFYARIDLAVGMRTHAQLIPFALGTPILSLISHDKLAWALEDLGVPGWGVEIADTEFVDKTLAIARTIIDDPAAAHAKIAEARIAIRGATSANMRLIRQRLAQNGAI